MIPTIIPDESLTGGAPVLRARLMTEYTPMFIAQTQPPPPTAMESFLAFLPWLVIFTVLWILLFVILRRSSRRTREEAQRAEAHARAVEAKLDALIEQNRQKSSGG
jgi:flagellar biosynthesis/type III secretory pathway M-ring protein FliF/YscJ